MKGLLSEYRKQGIGSKLIEKAIEHAVKKNGIEKVELEVYESNVNAIKLYEKFGFAYEGKGSIIRNKLYQYST